ncbi:hypothetical protein AWRI1631_163330 [Saccharomyces cerevisiae AWRI1631]|uniref:Uncharacterized protein n=1 Tax=Saccharomyces cerevisiae (strain AWRI1631) TaxID=545124 RepID=B5VTM1_YEAS6|nr:hypothetical protein AWRI1631_163330 [Saccharomyces cerevisiae AWRI1631]
MPTIVPSWLSQENFSSLELLERLRTERQTPPAFLGKKTRK